LFFLFDSRLVFGTQDNPMQSTNSQIILEVKLRAINLIHVNSANKGYCEQYSSRHGRNSVLGVGGLVWLGFCVLFCGVPGLTWAQAERPGQFSFPDVAPGAFQLTFSAAGLAGQTISGVLQSGENYVAPQISLHVSTALTSVRVEPPPVEVAEMQIKDQEKQRVLAVMPNFYVSYVPDAVPLTSKQKFELAWKVVIDPFTFGLTGVVAGAEQAENQFSGYGQGAQGYGKRFGAAYGNIVSGTFIGSAILPSIRKQDPRYFYKGTGSKRSRLLYAIANSVICKGDNRQWQPNYSNIAGSLIAGGLSNLYYPKSNRNRVGFVFENTAIGIGETAFVDVLQEFFIRKLTPKPSNQKPSKI
jgi:hypothetical protein